MSSYTGRTTRSRSLASSTGAIPLPLPSNYGGSSKARSQAARPTVPNNRSRAYGSHGQSELARPIIAATGTAQAASLISATVQEAMNSGPPIGYPGAMELPTVEEEEPRDTADSAGNLGSSNQPSRRSSLLDSEERELDFSGDLYRLNHSERAKKPWNVMNMLKYIFLPLIAFLFMADVYSGPLFGENYDFIRWRKDIRVVREEYVQLVPSENGPLLIRLRSLEDEVKNIAHRVQRTNLRDRRRINYFSPGLGALTVDSLSSQTKVMTRTWGQMPESLKTPPCWPFSLLFPRLWNEKLARSYQIKAARRLGTYGITEIRATTDALRPWQDVGDCWCAPSTRGKLQLAVILPRPIFPEVLIVENIHKDQTFDIGAAPKEVEFWAQVLDPELRESIANEISRLYPDIMTQSYSQRGKVLGKGQALDQTFVPIGRWVYNIHADSDHQAFAMPDSVAALRPLVSKVAVRVNSNWGSLDHTCLYRLRLYGDDPIGPVNYDHVEEE